MFGRVNFWQIAKSKLVGKKKFGEWMDLAIQVILLQVKFGWFYS